MSYFFQDEAGFDSAYGRLFDLHNMLYPRVRNHNLDLHPRWQKSAIISRESAACVGQTQTLALTYFRSREQAEMVEKLMGKEHVSQTGQVDTYRHPVIELRVAPDHFAIELILSPYAWWDQQNFIGKLELPHHRSDFRNLLKDLDADYRFGFWDGAYLSDMHLTVGELLRGRALDEWLATFADGQDWLRIGKWFSLDDAALDAGSITSEIFNSVKSLHTLYTFMLWTGNNNFHNFYEKRQRQLRRTFS